MWHFGNTELKIRPLKKLSGRDFFEKKESEQFSRTKSVMLHIEKIARSKSLVPEDKLLSQLSIQQANDIFDVAFISLLQFIDEDVAKCRIADLSLNTVHKRLKQKTPTKRKPSIKIRRQNSNTDVRSNANSSSDSDQDSE